MNGSVFTIDGVVISRCAFGALPAEGALFARADQSSPRPAVREVAFRTTAERARRRLAAVGYDGGLARCAAELCRGARAVAVSRGSVALRLEPHAWPFQMFDGERMVMAPAGTRAERQHYRGFLLDLPMLSTAMRREGGGLFFQGLFLASLLEAVDDSAVVGLAGPVGASPLLPEPDGMLAALGAIPSDIARLSDADRDRGPTRVDVRARAADFLRLVSDDRVGRTLLAQDALLRSAGRATSNLPTALAEVDEALRQRRPGSTRDAVGMAAYFERTGASEAAKYVRARARLLTGEVPAHEVAESASTAAEVCSDLRTSWLLLAAHAWEEAAEVARACTAALELLRDPELPEHIFEEVCGVLDRCELLAAPLLQRPERQPAPAPPPSVPTAVGDGDVTIVRSARRSLVVPATGAWREQRATAVDVAALLPPSGRAFTAGSDVASGEDARDWATALTATLGADLAREGGVPLRLDSAGVQAVERSLRARIPAGRAITPDDVRLVRSHGAFFCELLARNLGGRWVDVGAKDLGLWKMEVRGRPVFPFVLVVQALGGVRDLSSVYAELAAAPEK